MDKAIKKLLIDREITIADLARQTGYTRGHLSAIIHRRLDSLKAKRAISAALGMTFQELWGAEQEDVSTKQK